MEEFNHFADLATAIHQAVSESVRKTAFDILATAVDTANKDTGFMASSQYVVTDKSSGYGAGLQGDGPLLPAVDKPESDQEALIAVGAEYAIYVHDGARNHPGNPWLAQATEGQRDTFETVMGALEDKLREVGQ